MSNNILASDLKKIINSKINLIDIRNNNAYKLGHIMFAKNISKNELMFNTSLYLNKGVKYYIYCEKGLQSKGLVNYLAKQGYDVVNLIGGYSNYKY